MKKEIEELKNLKVQIMKKGIEQHFIKEDSQFIDICMRRGECNGCRYEKMCGELLKPEKEVKNEVYNTITTDNKEELAANNICKRETYNNPKQKIHSI